jgi:circadian clock protein KaiC
MNEQSRSERVPVSTGIEGLDTILGGGLTANRLYLVEGVPGAGKTTLALQFLLEGLRRGETVLYVTLSETEYELREVAASHGWSLDGVHIHELPPSGDQLDPDDQYTMFHPSEVELGRTTRRILDEVERLKPDRVVFDSLAELRLLAGAVLRFRRQVLALKQYFAGRGSTVLLLDESKIAEQGCTCTPSSTAWSRSTSCAPNTAATGAGCGSASSAGAASAAATTTTRSAPAA